MSREKEIKLFERLYQYGEEGLTIDANIAREIEEMIKYLKSEPEPGEFTKKIKDLIKNRNYWWCPKCQRELNPREVTYNEHHNDCGTFVGGDDEYIEELLEACEQIDRLEAELKEKKIDLECLTAERDSYFEDYHNLQAKLKAKDELLKKAINFLFPRDHALKEEIEQDLKGGD